MPTAPFYRVTLGGGLVKVSRTTRPTKTPPVPPTSERGGKQGKAKTDPKAKAAERKLRKYRDRQRELLYTVKRLPRGGIFATLTFDISTAKKRKRILAGWKGHLDRFAKRFKREFPSGGFIWTVELNPDNEAVHFHLLVKPGRPMSPPRFQAWAAHHWGRVSKNHAPDAVKASYLSRKRRNYVTKRKKRARALALIAHLGARYSFGTIAEANLGLIPLVRYYVPAATVAEIRKLLVQATDAQAVHRHGELNVKHWLDLSRADFFAHVHDDPALGRELERILQEAPCPTSSPCS